MQVKMKILWGILHISISLNFPYMKGVLQKIGSDQTNAAHSTKERLIIHTKDVSCIRFYGLSQYQVMYVCLSEGPTVVGDRKMKGVSDLVLT